MRITEKHLRHIIRKVLLEELDTGNVEALNVNDQAFVDQVAAILRGDPDPRLAEANNSGSLMNSLGQAALTAGKGVLVVKLTAPLLATCIMLYCQMNNIPITDIASGAPAMATQFSRMFGIEANLLQTLIANIALAYSGVTIARS
jgi:hypothetical protein